MAGLPAAALLIVVAMALAALTAIILVTTPARWLHDASHSTEVTGSRAFLPWLLVLIGVLIAGLAALALTLPGSAPTWTATAPGSGTTFVPPAPNWIDLALTALLLGAVAGATPVLILTDLLVRRLPDRIVYPLIGLTCAAIVAGILLGASPRWWFALAWAAAGLALFGGLHLLGRVLRRPTMGLGDVKLAFVVAGIAGLIDPWAPALVLVLTMLIAGVWAILAGLRAGRVAGVTIAFGPAMLTGLWVGSVSAPFVL
ncbi:prepilin peptidase [Brevibacterium casei]